LNKEKKKEITRLEANEKFVEGTDKRVHDFLEKEITLLNDMEL